MKQTISSTDLSKGVGEILNAVRLRGDRFIIEQRGKNAAAVVPVHILEEYEQRRWRLADAIKVLQAQAASADPEELEPAIAAEVSAHRNSLRTPIKSPAKA